MNQKSVLKAVGIFTFVTFILSIIPVTSWAQTIEDIAGEWKFIVDSYGLQLGTAQTVFTKKPDGTYEGTWTNHHGENKLSEIKFEKGKLSFIIEAELRITFKGAMTGGTIMGDLLTGKEWGGISASGTRIITKDLYIGEWEFKIKLPEQQILPCKAVFTKKVDGTLIGKWTVRERETELNKVKFEKEKINFGRGVSFDQKTGIKYDLRGATTR